MQRTLEKMFQECGLGVYNLLETRSLLYIPQRDELLAGSVVASAILCVQNCEHGFVAFFRCDSSGSRFRICFILCFYFFSFQGFAKFRVTFEAASTESRPHYSSSRSNARPLGGVSAPLGPNKKQST